MNTIKDEAARLGLLLDLGVVSKEAVVKWADDLVIAAGKPSEALINLSASSKDQIPDALQSLAAGADDWHVIDAALPLILSYVSPDPERARLAARKFYQIAVAHQYTVPDHLRFFLSAEDDFDLADDGVLILKDVYSGFLDDVRAAIAAAAADAG